jgi:hypothetical protein
VERDGTRDAIVGVRVGYLETAPLGMVQEELALRLDSARVPLLLGAYTEVEGNALRPGAVAVGARHG